jgi:hypothetical protein
VNQQKQLRRIIRTKETRNKVKKEKEKKKDDLGNLFDYTTLSPKIKKSTAPLHVWLVS